MSYIKTLLSTTLLFLLLATSNVAARSLDSDEVFSFGGFINDLVGTAQILKHGSFCVFGSDEISKVLFNLDKNIIDLNRDLTKYETCKAIYIAQGTEKIARNELVKFNKSKILTIAVFDGFTEIGGVVRVEMGRRNFELTVNSKAMKEAGIKLNSLATSLIVN